MNKLFQKYYALCQDSRSNMLGVLIRYIYYRLHKKDILTSTRVSIIGLKNIQTSQSLKIGMRKVGFINKYDRTFLNIEGKLIIEGKSAIERGCRLDIGKNAVVTLAGTGINVNTTFIIMHGMTIGENTSISWGCEFIDEDFHTLSYKDQKKRDNKIIIGHHVWIGSHVRVLKGSHIPNGCVVASGSVVTKIFTEENVLLAGNPARIIKKDIKWS